MVCLVLVMKNHCSTIVSSTTKETVTVLHCNKQEGKEVTISLYGRNRNTKYELDKQLREGGEGVVYTIKGQSGFVAKIYRPEHVSDSQLRNARRDKILAMLDMGFDPYYRGNLIVAWPKDALFDGSGSFVGFVMPKIENKKSLIWATRPSDRVALWTNGYRWQYSIAIAFNLALAIELMHQAGIVVGDMNPNNILINATGEVTLIDADSFNITEKNGRVFKCIVGIAEVLPAELQGKDLSKPTSQFNEKTDDFSLAVHIFNLLCNNCHPFGCLNFNVAKGSIANPQIMDNIVKGYCPYVSGSTGKTVKDALDMDVFPSEVRSLFDRAFSYNVATSVKQATISNRPSAREWRIALGKLYQADRSKCKTNSLHEYPKTYQKTCPWCAIERRISPGQTPQNPASPQPPPPKPVIPQPTPPKPPTPTKKSNAVKRFFKLFLILGLIHCLVMYSNIKIEIAEGDHKQAKKYMDLFPFYSQLFPGDYDNIVSGLYNQAVNYYRNEEYNKAYSIFETLDKSYKQTKLYVDFCEAHMHDPHKYFSTIFNNMSFEDAKEILMMNDEMFCRYMIGTWTSKASSGTEIVTMTAKGNENYTVNNFPELPDGGTFSVSNGVWYYKYKGTNDWIDFFRIRISSRDAFTLYSNQTGVTYKFTRN